MEFLSGAGHGRAAEAGRWPASVAEEEQSYLNSTAPTVRVLLPFAVAIS